MQTSFDCFLLSKSRGGLSMDAAELAELRAAALLPHEKFLLWSKEPRKNENFLKNIKLLSPYFANMR